MTVVVGGGRGDRQWVGCGGMWRDSGGGKETNNVAAFEPVLLNLGRHRLHHRRW